MQALGVLIRADNRYFVIYPLRLRAFGSGGTGDIRKRAALIDKPPRGGLGIQVVAHDRTAGIDILANRRRALGVLNVGPLTAIFQKAVWVPSGFGQILSNHCARVVNASDGCGQPSRHPDRPVLESQSWRRSGSRRHHEHHHEYRQQQRFADFHHSPPWDRIVSTHFRHTFLGLESGSDCTTTVSVHNTAKTWPSIGRSEPLIGTTD